MGETPASPPIWEAAEAALRNAAVCAILLLAPAALLGIWVWPAGVAFVAANAVLQLAGNLALATWRPAHFRIRRQGVVAGKHRGQPRVDAVGSAILVGVALAWTAFIPLDVFRLHMLPAPAAWVTWTGALAAALGFVVATLAVWENRFATPNVQDQSAGGQQVVQSGIYGLVRHPIYLGYALQIGGQALWLGSTAAALIGVGIYLAATLGRIRIEERDLNARLPAYAAYARRVRGRLIPFVL
ncbi:MAG TPA: isoprenylcysteine carboxylmethyltransferase family protein [Caulobacteraceae bacterium]|nr:isoprenylcysteine carboxylmethyltransferase family protein [Caulobacteraceae bacterium]